MKSINPLWDTNLGIMVRRSKKDATRLFFLTALALYTLEHPSDYTDIIMYTYVGLLGWVLGEKRVNVMNKLNKYGHYLTLNFIIVMGVLGYIASELL